jgi:hypothetical protein
MPNRPPPTGGTPRVCVLVANEPRVYRKALAALHPEASVVAVEPTELDGMVVRTRPDLVFCSSLAPVVEAGGRAWTLLYPDGAPRVETCVNGERADVADLGLAAALVLVDRAVALAEGRATVPGDGWGRRIGSGGHGKQGRGRLGHRGDPATSTNSCAAAGSTARRGVGVTTAARSAASTAGSATASSGTGAGGKQCEGQRFSPPPKSGAAAIAKMHSVPPARIRDTTNSQ